MNHARQFSSIVAALLFITSIAAEEPMQATRPTVPPIDLPDSAIAEAYQRAAEQNVLAAVNPNVFKG